MKLFVVLSGIFILALSADKCGKKNTDGIYRAKLEIKELCMNYTIRVLDGDIDTSLVVANWTDENTNKSYRDVFALGNPCSFPDTLKQGDEFYFTIDTAVRKDCMVCTAWYPTPPKRLSIKVVEK